LAFSFGFWLGTSGSRGFDTIVCYFAALALFTANSPTHLRRGEFRFTTFPASFCVIDGKGLV
jgi:hypothetical protein